MSPETIQDIYREKLVDLTRYKVLQNEPTPLLKNRLHDLWKTGISQEFVSEFQAKKVVGINVKDNGKITLSTNDLFKPENSYAYPLLKVHKLSAEQIAQKVTPPSRFVTDLSRSLCSRSDKFLAWKWLTPLMHEHSLDLIKDTTHFLQILEEITKEHPICDDMFTISIDVVSLYDSIKHDLAIEAFYDAISSHRPQWTPAFRLWLEDCVRLSFESALIHHKGLV